MEEDKNRVYVFIDGPNFFSKDRDFRIDAGSLKDYIGKNEGNLEKAIWYDVEPSIEDIDFEREQTPIINSLFVDRRNQGEDLCRLIEGLDQPAKEKAMGELSRYWASIQRTRNQYNNRSGFLHSIGKIFDVRTFPGDTFRNTKKCPNCNEEVIVVGKREGGIVDFNVAIDLFYHAQKNDYDTAVLGSGDGHYIRPVSFVKDMGKKVIVYSFNSAINPELRSIADKFVSLDSIYDKIKRERTY